MLSRALAGALQLRAASPYVTAFLAGDELPNSWGMAGEIARDGLAAMQSAVVYSCVRVLSEDIASLPLFVYRRLQPEGRERDPRHPLYPLLHDAPNPEMTAMSWRETLVGHVNLWGNHYSEIERDRRERVVALWPLRPDRMRLERDRQERLVYKYRLPDGSVTQFAPQDILHVHGLSMNGLEGLSPVQVAARAVALASTAERYGDAFFNNASTPGGILSVKGELTPEQARRLAADWEASHQGLTNANRVAVLEEGTSWQQVGIPPRDAEYLEIRKYQRSEIAGLFRVPLHKIGDYEHSTYSNVEELNTDYVISSIRPWCVRIEQELNRRLIDDEAHYTETLVDGLLRGNLESRYRAYATGRQWGWLSANDIRELENQNPIPGLDVYWMPVNMTNAQAGAVPPPPGSPNGEDLAGTAGGLSRGLDIPQVGGTNGHGH